MLEDDEVPRRTIVARRPHVETDVGNAWGALAAGIVGLDSCTIRLLVRVPVLVGLDPAMLLVELTHPSLTATVSIASRLWIMRLTKSSVRVSRSTSGSDSEAGVTDLRRR